MIQHTPCGLGVVCVYPPSQSPVTSHTRRLVLHLRFGKEGEGEGGQGREWSENRGWRWRVGGGGWTSDLGGGGRPRNRQGKQLALSSEREEDEDEGTWRAKVGGSMAVETKEYVKEREVMMWWWLRHSPPPFAPTQTHSVDRDSALRWLILASPHGAPLSMSIALTMESCSTNATAGLLLIHSRVCWLNLPA